jgi:hypothetical protein
MDPRGIPGSFESSRPEAGSAEPHLTPMARIQSWAGLAATLEVGLGYVPAQREYLAGAA